MSDQQQTGLAGLEPMEGGWSGRTFLAEAGGERTVVRVYDPDDHDGPTRDAAVLALGSAVLAGCAPVPSVVEVRDGDAASGAPGLLLTEHLPGTRGDLLLPRLDEPGLAAAGAALGEVVARLAGTVQLRAGWFADASLRIEAWEPPWDAALLEELVEGLHALRVAVGETVGGVEEDDPQAHRLGEVGQLGADVAVAHDAERAAADLVAALGGLVPDAGVHLLGLLGQPPREHDDLADDQLDDAAGVGERGVEDRDAAVRGGGQVDLVGADAEAADGQQVRRPLEHALGHLGVGADAQQAHAWQPLQELGLRQGAREQLDLEAAVGEDLDGQWVDVLEQQRLHPSQGRGRGSAPPNRRRTPDSRCGSAHEVPRAARDVMRHAAADVPSV